MKESEELVQAMVVSLLACASVLDGVNPGASCNRDVICGGGANCQHGACVCPNGHVIGPTLQCQLFHKLDFLKTKSLCHSLNIAEPGGFCIAGQTVCTGGSMCHNQFCVCPEGLSNRGGICSYHKTAAKRKVYPGSACTQNITCTGGSDCIHGVCLCQKLQNVTDGQCQDPAAAQVPIGGYCSNISSCLGGSMCRKGVCICDVGETILKERCTRQSTSLIDFEHQTTTGTPLGNVHSLGSCFQNSDCIHGGSHCSNGACVCPPNTEFHNNVCHSRFTYLLPGDACIENNSEAFCITGAQCIHGVCLCREHFVAFDDRCVPASRTVPPGAPCSSDVICGGNSLCSNGKCTCLPGNAAKGRRCAHHPKYPILPESSCYHGEICSGGSQCRHGRCTCPKKTKIDLSGMCKEI
uniref:EGF-like domain-containing protein n=1 Tax=Romanomermis culicivorax TaxID=13658 RepID=A0A915I783_ROMCU